MVAKGSVVGVLHDRHDLDRVVAQSLDARQDVVSKFDIGADAVFLLGHADMGFVDQRGPGMVDSEILVIPGKFCRGCPDLAGEVVGIGILDDFADVERDTVTFNAEASDPYFDPGKVLEGIGTGQFNRPVAIAPFQRMGSPVPAIEISGQIQGLGSRCPFAVDPAMFRTVEAKELVTAGKLPE